MSISINWHPLGNISIYFEMPDNTGCIELTDEANNRICLYVNLHQWWALRSTLPKNKNYTFSCRGQRTEIPEEADRLAEVYWMTMRSAPVTTLEELEGPF